MKAHIFAAIFSCVISGSVAYAADGATFFKQRCMMCHTIQAGAKGTLAPNLSGLANRKAGSTAFAYSKALKDSKITWTKATLDQFLRAPNKMVPGTRMVVNVTDDAQRTALVGYLLTLK